VTPIEQIVRDRISHQGPVPVSDFMSLALAHPEFGYYRKSDPLGRGGDFTTAPEISQAFGEIIGLWCVVTWQQAGQPTPVNLVELGPGRGTLMADALRAAAAVPQFTAAAKIHLVETSPALRARQKKSLHGHPVTWHDSLDTVPGGAAIFIANEFFDALPIDQLIKEADGWVRQCVDIDASKDRLCFRTGQTRMDIEGIIPPSLAQAPDGSLFEYCPAGVKLTGDIGRRLATGGIAALIIDYGYRRQAIGDTLQGVREHAYHPVLQDPGEVDLTAHVDFTALANAARTAGATNFGPVTQGTFLSRLGIVARTSRLAASGDPARTDLLLSGCHRLIDADAMGSLFKVLALTDAKLGIPAGFEKQGAEPDRNRTN
jgi:NADH dehydrogenase [ubiquinone] 1 alpha subcomplex assembly factor 7